MSATDGMTSPTGPKPASRPLPRTLFHRRPLADSYLSLVGQEPAWLAGKETQSHELAVDSDALALWGHDVEGATHLWVATIHEACKGEVVCPRCVPGGPAPINLREASAIAAKTWDWEPFDLETPGLADDVDMSEALDWLHSVHAGSELG